MMTPCEKKQLLTLNETLTIDGIHFPEVAQKNRGQWWSWMNSLKKIWISPFKA